MKDTITLTPKKGIKGEITVPGDKSISHRSIMFGSISSGLTEVDGFLEGADCLSTMKCFQAMGIDIQKHGDHLNIYGKGLYGLMPPSDVLDAGNSGTTTRLISGILSGQSFPVTLTGDASIQKRPMKRIIEPLVQMGADIASQKGNDCAPLMIHPAPNGLSAIEYHSPVASAQVKSCILLAGLYANGITKVIEPTLSRNHTELMLRAFGADIDSYDTTSAITPGNPLTGQKISVPGDISSAAYFIAAALITPNSDILIKNVNTNPTRAGILKVAEAMGGKISYENKRIVSQEEVCDLHITSSALKGTDIGGDIIPTLIDELPVIAVMAAYADGTTTIRDAAELKVKESNRIETVTENLRAMGCDIQATEDGMIIRGGHPLHGATIHTYMDHRIAMSFSIAALNTTGATEIRNASITKISFPDFYKTIRSLTL